MVNRSKKMSASSDSEDQSGSSSDSEDSSFVLEDRNASGRKRRRRAAQDHTASESDSEETIAAPGQRRRRMKRDRIESEEPADVPRRRSRRLQRGCIEREEPEDANDSPRSRTVQDDTDSEESYAGRGVAGGNGRRRIKQTRKNGKVVEAVWTPEKTVRITYDIGMKHACMNPIHGKAKQTYKVLHLVKCSWKNNVSMMTDVLSTDRSKPFQYCHKLCEPCLYMNGNRCFKCPPGEGGVTPIFHTVFGSDSVTCVEDFKDSIERWSVLQREAQAAFIVVHCTVVGPEARLLRRKFSLKRSTRIHIVYSDVRDRMKLAGSGMNLEESVFQHLWRMIMKEKVPCQESQSIISLDGNILFNENLSFNDFRMEDLLLLYERNIFDKVEEEAIRVSINTLHIQSHLYVQAESSECCLRDAVVHTHREPTTQEDDCMFQLGNQVANLFYKAVKRYFSHKIVSEFERRAGIGEALRIGDEGQKLPFRKLYVSRGGEVRFRSVSSATHDVARRDARSKVCGLNTSGFELVCWTQRGHPVGGDFVIPGLMYRFETSPGSCMIFRPSRYFHATLPVQNRDLKNEKFAAAFASPTVHDDGWMHALPRTVHLRNTAGSSISV